MSTVTKTFSAVGQTSADMTLLPQRSGQPGPNSFAFTIAGTFVATLILEYSQDGTNYTPSQTFTTTQASTLIYGPGVGQPSPSWRVRCSAYTSGSPAITMAGSVNIISQVTNSNGAIIFQVTESGVIVSGTVTAGAITSTGAGTLTAQQSVNVATVAGASALGFGSTATTGLQFYEVEEVVALASAGAKFVAMTCVIPSGAIILSSQMNLDSLVVAGGTSVKVGLGLHGGTCNTWGNTASFTKNVKANLLGTTVLAGDTTPEVCACATVATGLGDTNFSAGNVRVRIVYLKAASLPDAA